MICIIFYGKYNNDFFNRLYIPDEGLQFLPNELRYLSWYFYPLESLPDNLSVKKRVIKLAMQNGKILGRSKGKYESRSYNFLLIQGI